MQSTLNPDIVLIFIIAAAILFFLPHAPLHNHSFIQQSDAIRLFFETALPTIAAHSSTLSVDATDPANSFNASPTASLARPPSMGRTSRLTLDWTDLTS